MDISLDVLDIFKTVKNYVSNTTAKITEVKKSIFSIVRDSWWQELWLLTCQGQMNKSWHRALYLKAYYKAEEKIA